MSAYFEMYLLCQTHIHNCMKNILRLLFITLFLSLVVDSFGQVRVRGYSRKDGTYVRPHTRSYPGGGSGSSSSSLPASSRFSDDDDDDNDRYGSKIASTVDGKSISISQKKFKKGAYRVSPNLTLIRANSYSSYAVPIYEVDNLTLATSTEDTTSAPVYLSVMRVNGKVADIVPFPRSTLGGDADFGRPFYHIIDKSYLTTDQVLELIDKYRFTLSEGTLKKMVDVSSQYSPPLDLPSYVSHRLEVIRLR